jgi:arylformamidase
MTDCRHVPLWSGLSAEEHELQYNPQVSCPNFQEYQHLRAPANAKAKAELSCHRDLAYGEHPLRRIDIYPAPTDREPAPVHVFFHGGYWRAQDKDNFAFVAVPLAAAGITTVVANYELCPASTLDEVADSALGAVAWIRGEVAALGGDPTRISLSGHSAGAHLCAEVLAHDWQAQGISPCFIRGAVLISGIYDPSPAMHTNVNAEIRLTEEIAHRRNVERRPIMVRCPVVVFAGGLEPWHWIDQSYRYSHHLRRQGLDPEVHVLPGYNHFAIMQQYLDPQSAILRAVIALATSAK